MVSMSYSVGVESSALTHVCPVLVAHCRMAVYSVSGGSVSYIRYPEGKRFIRPLFWFRGAGRYRFALELRAYLIELGFFVSVVVGSEFELCVFVGGWAPLPMLSGRPWVVFPF